MSEKLTREELLDLLGKSIDDSGLTDELDRKALEGYQYLDDGQSADKVLNKLDDRFDHWLEKKEVEKQKKTRVRTITLIQRVAAAILLLLIPAFFIFRPGQSVRLANQFFEAPRSSYLLLNRGEQTSNQTAVTDAFALYEKGKFSEAAPAIEALINEYPEKKDLKFYQAISLLGSGHIDESIEILKQCTTEPDQDLDKRSPWYLALAYLMNSDRNEAKIWLDKTILLDAQHKEDAQILLEKI